MAQRRIIHDSDDDLGDEESQFLPRKYNKSSKDGYELMRLRDVQRFISKIYWLIILAFVCIGIAMAVVLNEGTFKDVFMAESLLTTVGVTVYVLLVAMLVMCHSHQEMRIALLLALCFFTGCVSGFMGALHLLDVTLKFERK